MGDARSEADHVDGDAASGQAVHPLVLGAAVAALLTAAGSLAPAPAPPASVTGGAARGSDGIAVPCGKRTVPEGDACIPLPPPNAPLGSAPDSIFARGVHPGREGIATAYEHVPRRPDRPEAFARYELPVGAPGEPPKILSGYDLHLPAHAQRKGRGLPTGHGGIDFAAERGAPVRMIALEHQEGDAEVVFTGELFGTTVATLHSVREGGRLRRYVVLFGHLERAVVTAGARPAANETIGHVGDSGSPGIVHLHLEVRQVREQAEIGASLDGGRRLVDPALTVVTDPRNVLALR